MLINSKQHKKCARCSGEFTLKRTDQIYCSPQCCTQTNNDLLRSRKAETKDLDTRLHINRNILKDIFLKRGLDEVTKDYLLGAGFDFGIYTGSMVKDSTLYTFCFEFGLAAFSQGKYKIVKR